MEMFEKNMLEFDVLYILTNDPEFYTDFPIYTNILEQTKVDKKSMFVVLEARDMINIKIIDTKINEMMQFQKYIEDTKSANDKKHLYTLEYLHKITQINFFLISMASSRISLSNPFSLRSSKAIYCFETPFDNLYGNVI